MTGGGCGCVTRRDAGVGGEEQLSGRSGRDCVGAGGVGGVRIGGSRSRVVGEGETGTGGVHVTWPGGKRWWVS